MDRFNLRAFLLTCYTSSVVNMVNNQRTHLYFKVETSIYKCRLIEVRYTLTGVKLVLKKLITGEEYIVSLDDYHRTWSDDIHELKTMKQLSFADLYLMENINEKSR